MTGKLYTSEMIERDMKLTEKIDGILYTVLGFSPSWIFLKSDKNNCFIRLREEVREIDMMAVFTWISIEEKTIEDGIRFLHGDGQLISYKDSLEKLKGVE